MTIERRDGEGMTEFTMRRIRNDLIEECAKVAAAHNGISPKDSRDIAAKIRNLADTAKVSART